jgi:hypothetical protein
VTGILFLLVAASQNSVSAEAPPRIVTEDYRSAMHRYDQCLQDAAFEIATAERVIEERYALYAGRCHAERASMVDAWMRGNPSPESAGRAARLIQFGWANTRANEIADIWAQAFLDPAESTIDPIPVTNIGNDASN